MSGELGKALAKKVTRKMSREQLEEYIANTLKKVKMCALVTSKGDIPRGTPLEYFSDGLTLYISPDPGTKTKNLKVRGVYELEYRPNGDEQPSRNFYNL